MRSVGGPVRRSVLCSRYVFILTAAMLAIAGCGGGGSTGTCSGSSCPTTVPSVTSTTPADNATGVATSSTVTATFSEAMDTSTLSSAFALKDSSGPIGGAVSYDASTNVVTFTPNIALVSDTQYTASISTTATASDGATLAATYSWTFTTAGAPAAAPTVTGVSPDSGPAAGGTTVTITGTNFTEATAVHFGSNSTDAFTATSATQITAVSPAGTGTVDVTVTTAAGTSAASTADQFTYIAAPTVTGVSPDSGPAAGGTTVTITGASFTGAAAVRFATVAATSFTVNSATQITADSPAGSGTVNVTVTTPDGTSATSSEDQFTYNAATAPTVSADTPTGDTVSVGTPLTASFSEAMEGSSLTSAFTLSDASGPVSGTVSYNTSTNVATFTPSSWAYGTQYTASISTGATAADGATLATAYSWNFTTGAAPANLVTVNYGTTGQEQPIQGFGGSTAWQGQMTTAQANMLFGQNPSAGDLGLSVLRVRIDPEGSASSNYVTGEWTQELNNGIEAQTANPNAIVFASPWSPPPSMKIGTVSGEPFWSETGADTCGTGSSDSDDYCGGSLNPADYGAYAQYLEDFVQYFANGSVNLYGISMQNEPDYADVDYESCYWTAANMDSWVASLTAGGAADPLTTRLIMPESFSFNPAQAEPTLTDTNAAGNVAIVGGHIYGAAPTAPPSYYAGKDIWMTEHYLTPANFTSPAIGDAISMAEEIHNSMVTGEYNAYVWWGMLGTDADGNTDVGNWGLINLVSSTPAPTYYGYAIGQFSDFVQPGYYRYTATAAPSSGVYVSTYSGTESGTTHYVIVAINSTSTTATLPFIIDGPIVNSMNVWETTSSGGLVEQGSPVTLSGDTFSYTLPAQSITTFIQ